MDVDVLMVNKFMYIKYGFSPTASSHNSTGVGVAVAVVVVVAVLIITAAVHWLRRKKGEITSVPVTRIIRGTARKSYPVRCLITSGVQSCQVFDNIVCLFLSSV